VDPVPDPLLLRKSGSAGNRTRPSRSVARNFDHYPTEEVFHMSQIIKNCGLRDFVGMILHLQSPSYKKQCLCAMRPLWLDFVLRY
jgi:hypothetical protein